jgi:hypothetical protein
MNRATLHEKVHVQVPLGIMDDLTAFVKRNDDGWHLWNRTKQNFISDWCYIYLYKMITALGNTKLEKELALQTELKIGHHTINNNIENLHALIYEWARTKIDLGNAEEWNAAAAIRQFQHPFEDVNLWIDSSDFKMQKSPATNGWFSQKEERRAIKVQFIVDATERVRYIKGPMEPGQFDGTFLQMWRDEINDKFKGGRIIGDNHYCGGTQLFEDPKFYCNERESKKDQEVAEQENLPTHSRGPKGKKRKAEIDISACPS